METIIEQDIKKVTEALKILDFSKEEITRQLNKIGELLIMKISINLLEKKEYQSVDGGFDYLAVEKFLKENYSPEEIKDTARKISNKLITNYFTNIMKSADDEKRAKIEAILNL